MGKLILTKKELTEVLYKTTNKVKIIEAKEYTEITFDPEEYVKVTSKEYINLMQLSSYYGIGVTKLRQFGGKKLWIDGNVDLSNTPTKSLGNVGYINGSLNIYNTNVSDISNISVKSYVSDSKTPIEKRRLAAILKEKMDDAESRREDDEWNLNTTSDFEGVKANVLFKWLVNNGDIDTITEEEKNKLLELKKELEILQQRYNDIEDVPSNDEMITMLSNSISEVENEIIELEEKQIDVYNIIPMKYSNHGMSMFEVIGVDGLENNEYSVGDNDEMDSGAIAYAESFIDDVGLDGFSPGYIDSYIDEDYFRKYFEEFYYDDVSENHDIYFTEDDYELSDEQESYKLKLEEHKEKLEALKTEYEDKLNELENEIEDPEEYRIEYERLEKKIDNYSEAIDDADEKINDIVPDNEPTQEMIDNKVEEMVTDAEYDRVDKLKEFELDLKDFISISDLAQGYVNDDGWGIMNGYDGTYDSESIQYDSNSMTFYIMRLQ